MDSKEVLESRRYLSDISVWPRSSRLDLAGWLANFDTGLDSDIAVALLASYVHLDEDQIVHAVATNIRSISTSSESFRGPDRSAKWAGYLEQVLVSFPLGDSSDPTASGYIFARIAERLGFAQDQILGSEQLVGRLVQSGPASVIFLDDLSASGTQFTRHWKRKYRAASEEYSLIDLQSRGLLLDSYYLPVIATRGAKTKIESFCSVSVVPTYLLDTDYQAFDSNTRLLPEKLRPHLKDFLEKYSSRTGKDEYGVVGYGDLGLALSFHHSCPNNTLPILQWGPSPISWKPLIT